MFEGFLAELKRRHLIRVTGVYAVAAWGVFQVAHTVFETFELPKWFSTLALVLLIAGLPVVLAVSWIFDRKVAALSPVPAAAGEGPAPPADAAAPAAGAPPAAHPRPKLSRLDMLLLAALVLVVGLVGAQVGGLIGGRATILGAGAPQKSVAVLPFVTFSAQKDGDYFADGLTEEVINSLAQVPDLKVAGRTSAFYFKGKNEDLREVGKRLGVAHVVEGSVRRDGDRLRVTAQLVSVSDGFHIWSRTYDRSFDDAFAVQSEIGQAVAEALKVKLDMKGRTAAAAERDPAAYRLEITSRAQLRRRGLEDLKAARAGFEQLMTLEPDNAAGYAGYAQATMTLAQNHLGLDFAEAQRVSDAALAKAIRLGPDNSQVWLARAIVSRVLSIRIGGAAYERDLDAALKRALALDPRNSEALTLMATRLADIGAPAEAEAAARKAVAVDPLSRSALMSLAKALLRVGKLQEAEQQYRSVTELYPDFAEGRYQLAMVLVEEGRLDRAEPWMKSAAAAGDDPFIAFQASWVYANLGLPEDAHRMLAAIKGSPGKELAAAGEFGTRGDWAGMLAYGDALQARSPDPLWPTVSFQAAAMLGRDDQALAALRRVRPDLLSPDAAVAVTDLNLPVLLAHVLRRRGETVQADRLLDRVLQATAPVKGARTPGEWRIVRAKAFAERGQNDQALAEVQAAVEGGWRAPFLADDSVWIEQQPSMVALARDPRFRELLDRVRRDLAEQRATVISLRR